MIDQFEDSAGLTSASKQALSPHKTFSGPIIEIFGSSITQAKKKLNNSYGFDLDKWWIRINF